MTPSQLAKSDVERCHQVALFAYCAVAYRHGFEIADKWDVLGDRFLAEILYVEPKVPALEWIHAIHNQGHGDAIHGAAAKAEGVRKGVADIFLPYAVGNWHGLYIEMKKLSVKPKRETSAGGLTSTQIAFAKYARDNGYGWAVCYGWKHAVTVIKQYVNYMGSMLQ